MQTVLPFPTAMRGPWYPREKAAKYCGYSSWETFKRAIEEEGHELPFGGPKGNRLAESILDAYMAAPDLFRKVRATGRRRSKPVCV